MTHLENTSASPKKRPLAPDFRRLDERSVRAWTESMAVTPLGDGRYAVDSQSDNRYVVNLLEHDCSCPDASLRGESCKHLRRVALEITRHEVPPPGKRSGRCRACDRETFLPEDGPSLCDTCRFDAGDAARDKETGNLVIVARSTDDRADEREIAGTGGTVADYESNRGYPDSDPVVEVVYPFSGDHHRSLSSQKHYAFPLSRLERTQERLVGAWD